MVWVGQVPAWRPLATVIGISTFSFTWDWKEETTQFQLVVTGCVHCTLWLFDFVVVVCIAESTMSLLVGVLLLGVVSVVSQDIVDYDTAGVTEASDTSNHLSNLPQNLLELQQQIIQVAY